MILDAMPTEAEARERFRYGLYARVPGKPETFLSPVWAYTGQHSRSGRITSSIAGQARWDAHELLAEFGHDYPGLVITMKLLATGEVAGTWTEVRGAL